jgi:protein phosphatase 1 regulatory subunit 11
MSRSRQPASNSLRTTTQSQESSIPVPATLRLRAEEEAPTTEETSSSRRIRWSEDVVDNEGMGKKSSKGKLIRLTTLYLTLLNATVCCIYHKARPVGESSSEESSSSSDSDSDSEDDRRTDRMNRVHRAHSHRDSHDHEHDKDCSDPHHDHDHEHGSKPRKAKRKPSPNAYEKMPKPSKNHNPARDS